MNTNRNKPGPKPDQKPLDELMSFIVQYMDENKVPPTQQAMADKFEVARFTIQRRLMHLVNQGKLINLGRRGCIPAE